MGVPCAWLKCRRLLCFKLDDTTIYAWFCEDLEPLSSSTSSSSLKKKAQNNFGRIQHKERLVEVQDGKSMRIASNTKNENPKGPSHGGSKRARRPPLLFDLFHRHLR
jgi:hypothetical protein